MDAITFNNIKNLKVTTKYDATGMPFTTWICYTSRKGGLTMSKKKLLKIAIENQRWDLAAHALVLGAVRAQIEIEEVARKEIKEGNGQEKGSSSRQSKRS